MKSKTLKLVSLVMAFGLAFSQEPISHAMFASSRSEHVAFRSTRNPDWADAVFKSFKDGDIYEALNDKVVRNAFRLLARFSAEPQREYNLRQLCRKYVAIIRRKQDWHLAAIYAINDFARQSGSKYLNDRAYFTLRQYRDRLDPFDYICTDIMKSMSNRIRSLRGIKYTERG